VRVARQIRTLKARQMDRVRDALGVEKSGITAFVGAGDICGLVRRLSGELSAEGSVLVTTTTQMSVASAEGLPAPFLAERYEDLESAVTAGALRHGVTCVTRGMLADGTLRGLPRRWIERLREQGAVGFLLVRCDDDGDQRLSVPPAGEQAVPEGTGIVVVAAAVRVVGQPLDEGVALRPEVLAARLSIQYRQRIEAHHVAQALLGPGGCSDSVPEGATILPALRAESGTDPVVVRTIVYELGKLGAEHVVVWREDDGRLQIELYE